MANGQQDATYERLERLEESPDNPFPLGRHLAHDRRNKQWPVRELLPRQTTARRTPWHRRGVFNQQSESSCTGQAAAGVVVTSPHRLVAPQRQALTLYDEPQERFDLYREAQRHDPWEGEEPVHKGSSTDAPFRVLRDRGHIQAWRWCFGLQDVLATLNAHGSVAVGTVWREAMFYPDDDGYIEVSGDVVGGHAYQLIWNDEPDRQVRAVNSWGPWGQSGRFWLTWDQLDGLLGEQGEAVTVVTSA